MVYITNKVLTASVMLYIYAQLSSRLLILLVYSIYLMSKRERGNKENGSTYARNSDYLSTIEDSVIYQELVSHPMLVCDELSSLVCRSMFLSIGLRIRSRFIIDESIDLWRVF